MKRLIIIFSLICSVNAHSQQRQETYSTINASTTLTKPGTDYWASGGSNLCDQRNGAYGYINPAGPGPNLNTVYAEFGQWSSMDFYYDPNIKYAGQTIIPSFLSFALPQKWGSVSLEFWNYYDSRMTARMERTTINHPEGTGEYIESVSRYKLSILSGTIAYPISPYLSVGMTAGLSWLKHHDKMISSELKGNGYGYSLILGLIFNPVDNFKFGFVIRHFSDIEYKATLKDAPELIFQPDMDPDLSEQDGNLQTGIPDSRIKFKADFPFEVETGISFRLNRAMVLSGKIGIQHWTIDMEEKVDLVNYHFGARLPLISFIDLSLGFFTEKDLLRNYSWYYPDRDRNYLTLGLNLRPVHFFRVSLNYLDSKILASKDRKVYCPQYFSGGVAVQF